MSPALLCAESLEFAQEQLLYARLTAQAALLYFGSVTDPEEVQIAGEALQLAVQRHRTALLRVCREISQAESAFPSSQS